MKKFTARYRFAYGYGANLRYVRGAKQERFIFAPDYNEARKIALSYETGGLSSGLMLTFLSKRGVAEAKGA